MEEIKNGFWERQEKVLSAEDVIVRFKQWMSDTSWRPEVYRHLPISVIGDASHMVPECPLAQLVIVDDLLRLLISN